MAEEKLEVGDVVRLAGDDEQHQTLMTVSNVSDSEVYVDVVWLDANKERNEMQLPRGCLVVKTTAAGRRRALEENARYWAERNIEAVHVQAFAGDLLHALRALLELVEKGDLTPLVNETTSKTLSKTLNLIQGAKELVAKATPSPKPPETPLTRFAKAVHKVALTRPHDGSQLDADLEGLLLRAKEYGAS